MGIVLFIVFGAIVGRLASLLANIDGSLLFYMVLGVIGSLLGGVIMNSVGGIGVTGFNVYSILVGVLGSIIVLTLARFLN